MSEDENSGPEKVGKKIGMDTPFLRETINPIYSIKHPNLNGETKPNTPEAAEIQNVEDAVKTQGFSKN